MAAFSLLLGDCAFKPPAYTCPTPFQLTLFLFSLSTYYCMIVEVLIKLQYIFEKRYEMLNFLNMYK